MENVFNVIKEKIKLVDFVSKFVKLKPIASNKYVGLCPFHMEKTPSFHVNSDTNLFYCFGCAKGGDLISFYCQIKNCDKKKAFEDLANMCNLSLKSSNKNINVLYKLLDFSLSDNDHLSFLEKRGVSDVFIKKFKLGWLGSFDSIVFFLNKEKLNFSDLGFKNNFFRFFQNRVTFPIFDEYGSLVSFAGRCLDDRLGKYINGAESNIFHKNKILYGLNFVQDKSQIYLVEGYLDVILMQQYGYSAVASMGTAVSADQLTLLWKYTDKIIVCFDGDAAGQNAAHKLALLSLEYIKPGKEIYFIILKDGYDPASYLQNFNDLKSLKEYCLYEIFLAYNPIPDNPDKKALYFKKLIQLSQKIEDKILRQEYRKKWNDFRWVKHKLNVNEGLIFYNKESLILLLFKYVLCYNELLDHVAEKFLKLEMKIEFNENLSLMLNNVDMSKNFIKKIESVGYYIAKDLTLENALYEWNKIYDYFQSILISERESRLLNDFSEEEWNLYKHWIEQKERLDEEK